MELQLQVYSFFFFCNLSEGFLDGFWFSLKKLYLTLHFSAPTKNSVRVLFYFFTQ